MSCEMRLSLNFVVPPQTNFKLITIQETRDSSCRMCVRKVLQMGTFVCASTSCVSPKRHFLTQGFINEAPSSLLLTAGETSQTSRRRLKGDRPLWFFQLSLRDWCHSFRGCCSRELGERGWRWRRQQQQGFKLFHFFAVSCSSALRKCKKKKRSHYSRHSMCVNTIGCKSSLHVFKIFFHRNVNN